MIKVYFLLIILLLIPCARSNYIELSNNQILETKSIFYGKKNPLRAIRLNVPKGISSIIYGNKYYGHYQVTGNRNSNKLLTVELLVPGFKYPIDFYYLKKTKKVFIKSIQFENDLPTVINNLKLKVRNKFTSNYFIISISLILKQKTKLKDWIVVNTNLIVNKLGEIVFSFTPFENSFFNSFDHIKKFDTCKYSILRHVFNFDRDSLFVIYSFDQSLKKDTFHYINKKYRINHDYYVAKDNLYSISYYIKNVWNTKDNELFPSLKKKRISQVVRYNLTTGKYKTILDGAKISKLRTSVNRNNFYHFNSIVNDEKYGILISVRNSQQLLVLDSDFKVKKIITGPKEREFEGQHAAVYTADGDIILMDNKGNKSGKSSVLKIDNNGKILWEFLPKDRDIYSPWGGDISYLPNGNILVLYPEFIKTTFDGLKIYELLDKSKPISIADMEIVHKDYKISYAEILPLDTFCKEKALGRTF